MDNKSGRYSVAAEEDFEPESNNEVLNNLLGIKSKREMDILESEKLEKTELDLLEKFDIDHQFIADDICTIHKLWLGDVYSFAGKYRSVNMDKDGFPFASVNQIAPLMRRLERDFLSKYTPCHYSNIDELAEALGVVHVEFILIHPFREGNGRTARVLSDLMAIQANYPPLNYHSIDQSGDGNGFRSYVQAIHAGFNGNYAPIKKVFKRVLEESVI